MDALANDLGSQLSILTHQRGWTWFTEDGAHEGVWVIIREPGRQGSGIDHKRTSFRGDDLEQAVSKALNWLRSLP